MTLARYCDQKVFFSSLVSASDFMMPCPLLKLIIKAVTTELMQSINSGYHTPPSVDTLSRVNNEGGDGRFAAPRDYKISISIVREEKSISWHLNLDSFLLISKSVDKVLCAESIFLLHSALFTTSLVVTACEGTFTLFLSYAVLNTCALPPAPW